MNRWSYFQYDGRWYVAEFHGGQPISEPEACSDYDAAVNEANRRNESEGS